MAGLRHRGGDGHYPASTVDDTTLGGGMDLVATLIEAGTVDYGLVVDGENSRNVVEATIKRLNRPETTQREVREQFATLTEIIFWIPNTFQTPKSKIPYTWCEW